MAEDRSGPGRPKGTEQGPGGSPADLNEAPRSAGDRNDATVMAPATSDVRVGPGEPEPEHARIKGDVPSEPWRHGVPFDRAHPRGRGGRG
ncbi:hypothetical protein [Polyangium jinanense]|uniref:Uncharacterized protein n=1 Tax=Polyangium jinanense TaxID=2829994 RepID=A0A9X4ASY5_9BACT|nr:hypothetical protein [Polyangium jinanense]MDC3981667.1 hypothetical protein [Polyangium jinanense]